MGAPAPRRAYELAQSDPRFVYTEHDGGQHAWGHPQRNHGATVARGRYLSWLGDDDIYLPDAFETIGRALRRARQDDPRVHLFRWIAPWKQVYWHTAGFLAQDHIDAECIVCPNVPEKLGVWTNRYQGDYDFIAETVEKWGGVERVVWQPEVIAQAQPGRRRGLDAGGPGGGPVLLPWDGGVMHPEARAFVAAVATVTGPARRVVELGALDFNGGVRDLFAGARGVHGGRPRAGPGRGRGGRRRRLAPGRRRSRPPSWWCAARCWSTPPGAEAIVRNAHALLAPGGRLVVTAAAPPRRPAQRRRRGRPAPRGVLPQRRPGRAAAPGCGAPASPCELLEAHPGRGDVYALARKAGAGETAPRPPGGRVGHARRAHGAPGRTEGRGPRRGASTPSAGVWRRHG